MPKMINADEVLLALKSRYNKAERTHDIRDMALTRAVMTILKQMPASEIIEGVICETCIYYNARGKTCMHNKGLPGRVQPTMYCFFGSKVDNGTSEEPDEEFNEFKEEANDS